MKATRSKLHHYQRRSSDKDLPRAAKRQQRKDKREGKEQEKDGEKEDDGCASVSRLFAEEQFQKQKDDLKQLESKENALQKQVTECEERLRQLKAQHYDVTRQLKEQKLSVARTDAYLKGKIAAHKLEWPVPSHVHPTGYKLVHTGEYVPITECDFCGNTLHPDDNRICAPCRFN